MIRARSLFLALALGAASMTAWSQQSPGWRIYQAADGLPESGCRHVSLGGAGDVFIQTINAGSIAKFDGYTWTNLSDFPANESVGRIYESPAGQLWAAGRNRLLVWDDGAWRAHNIPEAMGVLPATPLCPVRQNVVIFLLTNRLMEYSLNGTGESAIHELRAGEFILLGELTGMRPSFDDGLWICGTDGLAKISGPKRAIDGQSALQQFILPTDAGIANLREPQCVADGNVTCIGDRANGARCIVRFDGEKWKAYDTDAPINYAWEGPDGAIWAATSNALLRVENGKCVPDDEIAANAINDVAVGEHGMFWIATSEGLFCRAPELWAPVSQASVGLFKDRELSASELKITNAPGLVVASAQTPDGKQWCATREKIWTFNGQNWTALRGGLRSVNAMIASSDGSVWVASNEGLHRYAHGNWLDYDVEDGLPSVVVRDVREDVSGRIRAMSARGDAVFHPEVDADAPRTFLGRASERERSVPDGGSITINFSGTDKWNITVANRLLYSWRLDDREWSPFDSAMSATFIDLASGKHYFQARAMDRNGNIDSQPARLEFAVILPWYKERRSALIAGVGAAAALFFAGLAFKRHHELVLSHALVERQVAERTAELKLANEELLQSQKMKALGALSAGIAHDFNNILSIIKGSTQIIEQNIDDPQKIRARADRIKTVVDQGSAVVQALLGFSRNSDEEAEICEINSVVENTIRLLGDRFLRETTVRFDGGAELPDVRVSKGLVQQILLNFVFNAAESMTGRREVVISTAHGAKLPGGVALSPASAGEYVCVSVRDSGNGIAPEILPRVFEPFFTTKAMSSRRGTGLGLSVAYELARKMGAGLAVESTVGQGSVFTLILGAAPVALAVV